jgi:16S rRNA (guanine966-N2)-methyltransferase
MRILSGKYKNFKIITRDKRLHLDPKKIRPTTERLREAAFNIIGSHLGQSHIHAIEGLRVLDLCCGIGSFGIEALSRGASSVTFVDNVQEHLKLVNLNLEKINCISESTLICADARNLILKQHYYDLVYIDPPYSPKILDGILKNLIDKKCLANNSLIIVELPKRDSIEDLPAGLEELSRRKYGLSSLSIFQYVNSQLV